jgi:hypothetical protein
MAFIIKALIGISNREKDNFVTRFMRKSKLKDYPGCEYIA